MSGPWVRTQWEAHHGSNKAMSVADMVEFIRDAETKFDGLKFLSFEFSGYLKTEES